jgi:hypothetical protein
MLLSYACEISLRSEKDSLSSRSTSRTFGRLDPVAATGAWCWTRRGIWTRRQAEEESHRVALGGVPGCTPGPRSRARSPWTGTEPPGIGPPSVHAIITWRSLAVPPARVQSSQLNLDLGRARTEELHRRARSARLARHAHRSARARGHSGRLELRVGLAYLLVRWRLALLRPDPSDELDGRDAEQLLNEGAASSAFTA